MKKKQIEQLKEEGLVKMASDIPIPEFTSEYWIKKADTMTYILKKFMEESDHKHISWIAQIEDYCNSNGLIPEDLINFHRELSKPKIKVKNGLKIGNDQRADFFENFRKRKTGQ